MPSTSPVLLPPSRAVWLGRERELAEILAGFGELSSGRGHLVLVTGEPGIGKTRLCDEASKAAEARGIAVHWGRAWEAGGAPSFWPFMQILRSLCHAGDAARDALSALTPAQRAELVGLMPELARVAGVEGAGPLEQGDRFTRFDAIATFLGSAARRGPCVLVLDDLHAADPSSLQLLHFIVRDLRTTPLVILGTFREVESRASPEISTVLTAIVREATLLPLRRLRPDEVGTFVALATGAVPSEAQVRRLFARSEGNPLYVKELLRGGAAVSTRPESIAETVRARLLPLDPDTRRVLTRASVLGREIDVELLAALCTAPPSTVETHLEAGARAGIVERHEQPAARRTIAWRFTHVLLCEALYEAIDRETRTRLHHDAARALQRASPTSPAGARPRGPGDSRLTELVRHLLHAVPAVSVEEAVDGALCAAREAMALLAFEDAGALLARAAALLGDAPGHEARRFELRLALGVARVRAGELQGGRADCLAAADLARRLADGERLARAALGAATEFVPHVHDHTLIALLEEALAALPAGDGDLRARCLAQLAAERQPEPDPSGPAELAHAAIAMARRLGDEGTLRFTLSLAGLTLLSTGDPSLRQRIDQESLHRALSAGDTLTAMRAHLLLHTTMLELGDLNGALAHTSTFIEMLQLRYDASRWVSSSIRASAALWRGHFDEAWAHFVEFERLWQRDEVAGIELVVFPLGFSRAAERYDDLPAIESRIRRMMGTTHALGACLGEMFIAQLYARTGDLVRVRAQLDLIRTLAPFERITEASWLAVLVEPCLLVGDVVLARRLERALLPRAAHFFAPGPIGCYCEPPFARQLGLLALMRGDHDAAVLHLAAAVERSESAGMRSHLARLRLELATALLARKTPSDRADAERQLSLARALATELGQAALSQRLDALVADELGPRDAPAPELTTTYAPSASAPDGRVIRLAREGDTWALHWGSRVVRLRDSLGLQVLERLIANRGQELHVLQLLGAPDGARDAGDAGELLDDAAIQRYRRRLLELRDEVAEAERFSDPHRKSRASDEIEALTRELARAVGLGGRQRRASVAAERARVAVRKRITTAIDRIEQELPDLGLHLRQTVRTGTFCGYLPAGRLSSAQRTPPRRG